MWDSLLSCLIYPEKAFRAKKLSGTRTRFVHSCFLLSLARDFLWSCQPVYVAGGADRCAARPPKKIPASLSWKQPRASEQTHLCAVRWRKLPFRKSTPHRPETFPGSVSVANLCVFSGLSSQLAADENWSAFCLLQMDTSILKLWNTGSSVSSPSTNATWALSSSTSTGSSSRSSLPAKWVSWGRGRRFLVFSI